MKIVIDCGNGVAGDISPRLFKALGCEVVELSCEVDGNFANHHPDPPKLENLADVIEALRRLDAEIGLAFDGDDDRLGVVLKYGEVVFPDRQLMLFGDQKGQTRLLRAGPDGIKRVRLDCSGLALPEATRLRPSNRV